MTFLIKDVALMIVKLLFKIIVFFGLYWLVVALSPVLIYELVTKKGSADFILLQRFTDILIVVAIVLAILTTIQNIVRMIKKDRSFNIYKSILIFKEKKKGFEAKVDKGNTIALRDAAKIHGFVFGKKQSKYVIKPEQTDGHILIIGGAGSGKTTGTAIPTLMSWKERVFAIDIKGELYEKTSQVRGKDKIKVFNPTDPKAFGYDPYHTLKYSDDISESARNLAISICPLPADVKDPFWIKGAQNMLTGLIIHFFSFGYSFSKTMKLIKSQNIKQTIAEILESGNEKAIAEVSQFDGMDEKTLSGVFAELSNHITVFATNDNLQKALNGEGQFITPQDLEDGFDIYCCIPENKLEQWKDLLGMMINQFLKSFESREEKNKKPILFLIDEFPRLGKIETISNGLATLRGRKIQIALIVQSKSQLNALYGKDVSEVIADNCTYKAILKASEPSTQEWCSKLVGTYDKRKDTSNYSADMVGIGKGQGTSITTEEKRIIKPEEFAYLEDVVCIFPNGYQRLEKIAYYKDRTFLEKSANKERSF